MGVFHTFGVEYAMKMKNGEIISIIPMSILCSRFMKTKHYKERYSFYIDNRCESWRMKIDNIDIQLANDELAKIAQMLNECRNDIDEYGFYDVGIATITNF